MPGYIDRMIREGRRRNKTRKQAEESRSDLNELLSYLRQRAGDADRRAGMSVQDLFGEQITRSTDQVRANANATKANLARLSSAGGGDATGGVNVAMNQADELTNESIGDIYRSYTNLARGEQNRSRSRADQLMQLILGSKTGLLKFDENLNQLEIQRELARRQANKQLFADIFGIGGNVLSAGIS